MQNLMISSMVCGISSANIERICDGMEARIQFDGLSPLGGATSNSGALLCIRMHESEIIFRAMRVCVQLH
jgi:hypothetical protein